jgi:hypothetical protein
MEDAPRWIRHRPDAAQRRASAGIALGVALGVGVAAGLTTLYLTRLLIARERITPLTRGEAGRERATGAGA